MSSRPKRHRATGNTVWRVTSPSSVGGTRCCCPCLPGRLRLRPSAAVLGLDHQTLYVPFAARRTDGAGSATLQRVVAERCRGQVYVMVPKEQQLVGLLSREPHPIDNVLLAVGPKSVPAHAHEVGSKWRSLKCRATSMTQIIHSQHKS
jgi:hypothetical protein